MSNEKQADEVFCTSCGAIIKKEAEICPKCGVRQFGASPGAAGTSGNKTNLNLDVAGLVLGILSAVIGWIPVIGYIAWAIGIAGIVISVKARKKAIEENKPTGMATAGLIVSIVGTVIAVIELCVCVACVSAATELSNPNYWF